MVLSLSEDCVSSLGLYYQPLPWVWRIGKITFVDKYVVNRRLEGQKPQAGACWRIGKPLWVLLFPDQAGEIYVGS